MTSFIPNDIDNESTKTEERPASAPPIGPEIQALTDLTPGQKHVFINHALRLTVDSIDSLAQAMKDTPEEIGIQEIAGVLFLLRGLVASAGLANCEIDANNVTGQYPTSDPKTEEVFDNIVKAMKVNFGRMLGVPDEDIHDILQKNADAGVHHVAGVGFYM